MNTLLTFYLRKFKLLHQFSTVSKYFCKAVEGELLLYNDRLSELI